MHPMMHTRVHTHTHSRTHVPISCPVQKIRRDPVLMKGLRAMFVHFHMRPERLQREEAALKERIAGAGQS